jgi:glycosyltransferase involved in cell wall biosynthesis
MAEEHASAPQEAPGKLRICVLIPKLQIGGAEMHVLSLLRHIDKSRFAVSLLCFNAGNERMEGEAARFVESFETVDFRWRRAPVSFARIVRFLRRGRFDVVHCHLVLADSVGRLAGWCAGVPVRVTTEHGKHLWKPPLHLLFERMIAPLTDARICVSRDILEIRRTRERTPASKLFYIPNGVDTAVFGAKKRDRAGVMAEFGWDGPGPLVVAVGRLEPEKRYDLLVRAVGSLLPRFPAMRCLLVGDGRCRAELAALVDSLGIADAVKLAGARDDVPDLLGAADLFVLSSSREGLPVSLLEAMAAGAAIVATAVGGIPEAIRNRETGLLVPPEDVDALAGAIGSIAADASLGAALGRAAQADAAREYAIERVVGRIEDLYRGLRERTAKGA